jgi:hypothetical protein
MFASPAGTSGGGGAGSGAGSGAMFAWPVGLARVGVQSPFEVAEVLATAQDPHISVRWQDATLPTWQRTATANIDLRSIQKAFPKLDRIGRVGLRASTDDDIGYLYVATFAREQRDDFDQLIVLRYRPGERRPEVSHYSQSRLLAGQQRCEPPPAPHAGPHPQQRPGPL